MDIIAIGTQLLNERLGLSVDADTIASALRSLLGDGDGNIDLAGLASRMAGGNLDAILQTWLGDGDNAPVSAQDILGLFGQGQVSEFASTVGTDTDSAAAGLADVLPRLMDQASSGGNLLDSLGGAGGLLGAAKSLLG
ncbi:MAG: hypothetical protein CME59_09985 [Halioglobus sp.]|nr:hypothetical protein [Halioglobus sp.]|tara:strand:- start:590 stop:1003 length:414 start_codon:yes stop_codon:yes gene_type:complete